MFANLRWRHRRAQRVTVPFVAGAAITGRLSTPTAPAWSRAAGRVGAFAGALMRRRVANVRTGRHGGFRLPCRGALAPRHRLVHRGEAGLAGARRPALALRVRRAVTLGAAPRSGAPARR